MLSRTTVMLAKIEESVGVDASPAFDADALPVFELDLRVKGDVVAREVLRPTLGPLPFLRGARWAELSFRTELKGTGSPGVLPARGFEGALFRACGMSEEVNAGTSVVYTPVSTGIESASFRVVREGLIHSIFGARGTFRILLEAGKPPAVAWKFYGLTTTPEDGATGTPVYASIRPPLVLAAGLSIGGYAPVAEKIEIDWNARISERRSMNAAAGLAGFEIVSREPRGSFDPEAVLEAEHPFWTTWEAAGTLALAVGPLGSDAGNRVAIAAPGLQYREITAADRRGALAYTVPFGLAADAGDDELTVTFS